MSLKTIGTLALIQLWWISTWGLAYLLVGYIAGNSKIKELIIYSLGLLVTLAVFYKNPQILDRL
jgi:hypothetical protein